MNRTPFLFALMLLLCSHPATKGDDSVLTRPLHVDGNKIVNDKGERLDTAGATDSQYKSGDAADDDGHQRHSDGVAQTPEDHRVEIGHRH